MIHTFALNGYFVAVDPNSGSIHLLDDLAYAVLADQQEMPTLQSAQERLKDRFSQAEIAETFAELMQLVESDCLFTPESSLRDAAGSKRINTNTKALCLHVAHDCNLRCAYCFASEGDYKTGRCLMSREVAFEAIDYLIAHSEGRKSIEIDFFGGEPLMNFDVVRAAVAYAKEQEIKTGKQFYFTITTNGTLLDDEKIDFINRWMDNVVISIDGRREVHDAVRKDAAGNGSYDIIVPAAQKLIEKRGSKSYFVRGTFTAKNKDFTNDVMHLADLGFREISVEPAVGEGGMLSLTEKDIPELLVEYEKLACAYAARLAQGENFRFYHFNLDLYDAPCIFKKISACGAGGEYLAVSPEGDLYPCHQFVGEPEFLLGNLKDGIKNKTVGEKFRCCNVLTKPECRACWAKLFCSGGCYANAYFSHRRIDKPNEIACTLQKKRIECAVMLQAMISEGLCDTARTGDAI